MMIDDGSIKSRRISGNSASNAPVGKHPGSRDQPCLAQFLAIGTPAESVNRLFEELRRGMIEPVSRSELCGDP